MKTILILIIGFLSFSCSYEEPNSTSILLPSEIIEDTNDLSKVVESMKGEYHGQVGYEKDVVIITETTITIKTDSLTHTVNLTQEVPTETKINCKMSFILPDGSIMSLLLGWKPETPENRNLLFVRINDDYVSALERFESNLN